MDSRIESTQALISQHAKGKLITEPVNRLPFFALEQGGVNLTKDGIPLEDFKQYFDVDQLDQEKLLLIVDRLIIPSAAVFNFEVGERLTDIIGLSSVIKDLRAAVFEGAEKGRLIDLVNESRTPLPVQMPFLKELLGKQPKITQQLAEISAKVDVTLNVV